MTARVVLPVPEVYQDSFRGMERLAIYPRIEAEGLARGGVVAVANRPSPLFSRDVRAGDGDLHMVESRGSVGEGWQNAAVSHLEGDWHLDWAGVRDDSSISEGVLDPALVDPVAARRSRYWQARQVSDVPEGSFAVFRQRPAPQGRGQSYSSYTQMLRSVAARAGGRPNVVKAHPVKPEMGKAQIAKVRAKWFDLITSSAKVHDILARAAVTVSVNSAAAIAGFLDGKRPKNVRQGCKRRSAQHVIMLQHVTGCCGQQGLHLDASDD